MTKSANSQLRKIFKGESQRQSSKERLKGEKPKRKDKGIPKNVKQTSRLARQKIKTGSTARGVPADPPQLQFFRVARVDCGSGKGVMAIKQKNRSADPKTALEVISA